MQVCYRGQSVGQVEVRQDAHGVTFDAVCRVETDEVLRLYGLRAGCEPLRIDVAEPGRDGLRVRRTLRWQALRAAGYDALPEAYVLAAGTCGAVTGDARIDALLAAGTVQCSRQADGWRVHTAFVPGAACPLAFALTACVLDGGQAVLTVPDRGQKDS